MSSQSLRDFILNYPYPAFILDAKPAVGHLGPSLEPTLANKHFNILLGTNSKAHKPTSWLELFESVDDVKQFTLWVFGSRGACGSDQHMFTVNLKPPWVSSESSRVTLQLIKAAIPHETWTIISFPLSTLPPDFNLDSPPALDAGQSIHHSLSANLDFPPPSNLGEIKSSHSTSLGHRPSGFHISDRDESKASPEMVQEHKELFNNFPWHETPLGARDTWPVALRCYSTH